MKAFFLSVVFDVYADTEGGEVRVGEIQSTVLLEKVTLEADNSDELLSVTINRGIGNARGKAAQEWITYQSSKVGLKKDIHFRVVSHTLIKK